MLLINIFDYHKPIGQVECAHLTFSTIGQVHLRHLDLLVNPLFGINFGSLFFVAYWQPLHTSIRFFIVSSGEILTFNLVWTLPTIPLAIWYTGIWATVLILSITGICFCCLLQLLQAIFEIGVRARCQVVYVLLCKLSTFTNTTRFVDRQLPRCPNDIWPGSVSCWR